MEGIKKERRPVFTDLRPPFQTVKRYYKDKLFS